MVPARLPGEKGEARAGAASQDRTAMTFAGFSKSFRWNDGIDTERYAAVEVRNDGLLFYEWSHLHGEGRVAELVQSFDDFRARGPARPVPASVRAELDALVAAHEPD
jgi:hypothetical protein